MARLRGRGSLRHAEAVLGHTGGVIIMGVTVTSLSAQRTKRQALRARLAVKDMFYISTDWLRRGI